MSVSNRLREIRSSDKFILVAMCFAIFTDTFIYGMIVPILPYLLLQGGQVSKGDVQKWTSILLAAYGAALLVGSPIIGLVSDRIRSRRSPLLFGYITIAASTLIFALGGSPAMLTVARVCQGLSGAVIGVLGLAIIADAARPETVGEFMAYGSLSFTWGMLMGPVFGGLLYDHFGSVGAFGLPIAMLVVDIILRVLIIERDNKSVSGAAVEAPRETDDSTTSQEETPLLAVSPADKPSLSLRNFFDTRLATTILIEITISSIISVFETTLPLFTIETYQWAPTNAGLVFLGLTLPSFFSIPLARYTSKRSWDRRKIVAIELVLCSLPMVGLKWTQGNTLQQELLFIGLISFVGLFLTTCQAQVLAEVSESIRQIEARHGIDPDTSSGMGTGFAFCNMAIAAGQFIGPLIAGVAKIGLGWSTMTIMLGVLSCSVGLVSFIVNGSLCLIGRTSTNWSISGMTFPPSISPSPLLRINTATIMYDSYRPHPLLAQIPLTVSPFINLPTSVTLPYTYKSVASILPPSVTVDPSNPDEKARYVVSSSGEHAAHPDDILAACHSLETHLNKTRSDADQAIAAWEDSIKQRELAEKRRLAPGWLDREEKLLQPSRTSVAPPGVQPSLLDSSSPDQSSSQMPAIQPHDEGEELDRAFGGLGVK
ncbi:unnamed protein product [Penicillium salamii]|uniref:Major facilitator superfamily (MFS) profile domain-containing protein n=1 Tax=Penicillium salamii TaxID=1612424 RepID=A0A9W4IWW3_9EURO|nr:unnamed protein product [Penicillium salamii]CAG8037744.1 unnamed protein product [Penicillium salamii]CAG8054150.1 unnamed protein product [Penicillium salamii]CAG8324819.1 unnamed protein product [Penicillium salamii]CAG8358588.1 unnamed protein product [Penicillium salamii]